MEDHVKVLFARIFKQSQKPEDCPKWIIDAYGLLSRRWSELLGNRECRRIEWPMLALVAELNQKLETRVAALEGKTEAKPVEAAPVAESPKEESKIDLRTKEGRAMKSQMVGV